MQLHQHPGAAAQVDIQTGDICQGAGAVDPAVFRPDVPKGQAAHLVRHQGFQPEEAGNRQDHGYVTGTSPAGPSPSWAGRTSS